MKKSIWFLATVAALVLMVLSNSIYVVNEYEQVIITEFGRPVGEPINSHPDRNEAGLHFKKPFIQKVNSIEKRILEWDGPSNDMPTRDKLFITVDTFARWRIVDPRKYMETLRDERSALSRLDDYIGSATRSVVAKHDLIEVVRSDKTRKPERDVAIVGDNTSIGQLPAIQYGRSALTKEILLAAQPSALPLGIELIDVRFKRINYKQGVIDKIYSRMSSERKQIAERFRSEGQGEAAKIIGLKERELQTIESGAYRREQEIKGKADAKATEIYAQAYSSNGSAADFYQFVKTLDTYKTTLDKDTTAIFTTDGDLFRLLKRIPVAGQ